MMIRDFPYNNSTVRDKYNTPSDRIWGDVIKHEKLLDSIWKETWEDTIVPKQLQPQKHLKKGIRINASSFYQPKPSSNVPPKASEMVGWRSTDPDNSLEYFNVKYVSMRRRFVKEQYGNYRALKYIENAKEIKQEEKREPTREGKYIRHQIKCLVF